MRIAVSPTFALILLAAAVVAHGDRWLYAWLEAGPAPVMCSTVSTEIRQ